MKTKRTDPELDELLAPDSLSGAEHDRVFDAVLQQVVSQPRAWLVPSALAGLAVTFASVVGFFLLAPRLTDRGFRAKGGAETLLVEAACVPEGCRPGARLLVALSNVKQAGYANAYATSPSGKTVWYFSGAEAPMVEASRERRLLAKSVILGQDHEERGAWTLHVVLSQAPTEATVLGNREAKDDLAATVTFRIEP